LIPQPTPASPEELVAGLAVKGLVATASAGEVKLSAERVLKLLVEFAQTRGKDGIVAKARFLGITDKVFFGIGRPSLLQVLWICISKGIHIENLFRDRLTNVEKYDATDTPRFYVKPYTARTAGNRAKLLSRLVELSDVRPPLSIKQVAQKLGVCRRTLEMLSPSVCAGIRMRRKSFGAEEKGRKEEMFKEEIRKLISEELNRGVIRSRNFLVSQLSKPGWSRRVAIMSYLQAQVKGARALLIAQKQSEFSFPALR
jgi:hypothetical protein